MVNSADDTQQESNPLAESEEDVQSMGTGEPSNLRVSCADDEEVQEDTLVLEFHDDVQLPDDAELVVEGLRSPMRVPVTDCYDTDKGVYRFTIDELLPGRQCRIRIETPDASFTTLEDFDLYDFVQRARASDDVAPLPLIITDELFDHHLNYDDFEIDEPPPEAINWEAPPEFDTEEGEAADQDDEPPDSTDVDIDPAGEN